MDASDDFSDSESSEYGLRDLANLPLLEQVHRLFHAIQQKYPYTETNAWKQLPLEQKRVMLQYIRERRVEKQAAAVVGSSSSATTSLQDAPAATIAPAATTAAAATSSTATRVKTDPYLQMLQKRTLTVTPSVSSSVAPPTRVLHPNSSYTAGQPPPVAQYVESNKAAARRSFRSRWKVAEAEFYDEMCACGTKHDEPTSAATRGALVLTMRAMLSTFGDHTRPCLTAVKQVKTVVGNYLRSRLSAFVEDMEVLVPCLRLLVEVFPEEATYYGRWREFRGETKQQEADLEVVEEDDLAEELDLFAISEADVVFNETFLERIRFADERTRAMDWSIYDSFAKSRKLNFMSQKGFPFRQWLGLGSCSRASLEFMNFVAYHNIGRLVEAAIKIRTGGLLQVLASPLLESEINAATEAFQTAPQYHAKTTTTTATTAEGDARGGGAEDHGDEPPSKMRRVDDDAATTTTTTTTSESSSSSSPSTGSAVDATGPTPQRLTRLKRLR